MAATDLFRAQEKRMAKKHDDLAKAVAFENGYSLEARLADLDRARVARLEGERTAHIHALTLALVSADSHANYVYYTNKQIGSVSPGEASEIEVLANKLERIAATLRGRA